MATIQSDEKLTKYLDQTLSPVLSRHQKCISNSLILPSKQGSHLVYFAKDPKENLVLVAINVSVDKDKDSVRIIPVKVDSLAYLENTVLEFSESPYLSGAFAIMAYDPRERFQNREKFVYVTSIILNDLKQGSYLQFKSIASKNWSTIKDIKWYPFAALTLLVLTETRVLVFKLDMNAEEPLFDFNLKDLEVQNASEVTKKDQFHKIGFAENLNLQKGYSSLGKKLSLYLITNSGCIYLLFPFVPHQIILDETEKKAFQEIRNQSSSSLKRSERAQRMAETFKNSEIGELIEENSSEQKNSPREYALLISWPSKIKREIFRLNPVTFSKSSLNNLNASQKVQIFKSVTLGRHTLFLTGLKLKNKQYEFRVMVFSEEPYSVLLQTSHRSETFNLETVGQIRLDQSTDDDKVIYSNGLQLLVPPTLDNIELYLTHDKKTSYRVSLYGLEKFLRNPDQEDVSKLVEVYVLFESKHKLVTMQINDISVFVVRNSNESYLFESIPLKSLELKEKIDKTIQETETLFKQLALRNSEAKSIPEPKSEEKIDFKAFKESTLIDIQTKLKTFSEDYQKSVENKMQKIKKLYDQIQSKNQLLKNQENQKQEMAKLVSKAEENEKTIKQMFSKDKNYTNKTEDNIRRRIQAADKLLNEIKQRLTKESKQIQQDPAKKELMDDCQDQADGVINKLEEIKQQLIAKKMQLKKDLGQL